MLSKSFKSSKKYQIDSFNDIYSSLREAKRDARFFSRINHKTYYIYDLVTDKQVCSVDYYAEAEYQIYIDNDKSYCIRTIGLQQALELARAYAKTYAGDKIVIIDEDKNIVKEFFEEKAVESKTKAIINPKKITKEDWDKSHQDFTCLANAGDTVDEDIVQYFRDCLPPVAHNAIYLQCGEPYTHDVNPKNTCYEPAFITFVKENNTWRYKGICFLGEQKNIA